MVYAERLDIGLSSLYSEEKIEQHTLNDFNQLSRYYRSDPKKRYVLHHELFKFYLSQGIKIKTVYKILTFDESKWFGTLYHF